jgi:Protein phosphatase 2C
MATSAAAPGRPNEDFVGVVPSAAVLLDGAGIPGTEEICEHGVAWYAHRLGGVLLGRLSRADGQSLAALLGDAIDQVTDAHRETCDVTDPSSPSSTVAIVRLDGEHVDYLVLGDSFLVFDLVGTTPIVVTDSRERDFRRPLLTALAATDAGTPEYDEALRTARASMRAGRNQPGGFWVAKDDPQAAAEAITGRRPLGDLESVALLSNGASRIVDHFGLADWRSVLTMLGTAGPDEVIRRVREAESTDPDVVPDDATAAYCTMLAT